VKDVILNYSQGQVYNGNISVGYKEDALDTVSYIDVVPKSEIEVAEVLKQAISEGMITVPKSEEEYKKWNVYSALAAVKLV